MGTSIHSEVHHRWMARSVTKGEQTPLPPRANSIAHKDLWLPQPHTRTFSVCRMFFPSLYITFSPVVIQNAALVGPQVVFLGLLLVPTSAQVTQITEFPDYISGCNCVQVCVTYQIEEIGNGQLGCRQQEPLPCLCGSLRGGDIVLDE